MSAVKTKGIDISICVLSLRRVLEMICNDLGSKGKTLESMIDDLVEKKELPEMIKDACWIIRKLGNDAAHKDFVAMHSSEVEQVIGYLADIINYLYSMPKRVADMRYKLENRNEK